MDSVQPVELLKRQYLQLVDPEQLTLPTKELLRSSVIQAQIYHSMFDDSVLKFAPPERYRLRVLKRLVNTIEDAVVDPEEDEISDDLSGCLAQYMAQPLPSASAAALQKGYVTYTDPKWGTNVPQVTLLEAPSLLAASGTTGLRTWEAALLLGTYLVSEAGSKHVIGQKIIELGAGTGFLSILCAKRLNARHVLTTDGSREVVAELKANLELNNLGEGDLIKSAVLEWGHALTGGPADCRGADSPYDLVIGADVTYDFKSMPALIATIRDLFELYPKLKVLISAEVRNEKTLECFLEACDTNGFKTTQLEVAETEQDKQTGFFIADSSPIQVFLIVHEEARRDTFAT